MSTSSDPLVRWFKRPRALLALGVVVASLVVGGVALATVPDSGRIVHFCYLADTSGGVTSNSQVRVIDPSASQNGTNACRSNEKPLNMNQQGPKGDTGPIGATGLKGDPGTPGTNGTSVTSTSLAAGDPNCPNGGSQFTAANGLTYACNGAPGQNGASDLYVARNGSLDLGIPDSEVARVTVPAGNYLVQAKAVIANLDSDRQFAHCTLSTGDDTEISLDGGGGAFEGPIALLDTAMFSGDNNSIVLHCGTYTGIVFHAVLTALKVGTIH